MVKKFEDTKYYKNSQNIEQSREVNLKKELTDFEEAMYEFNQQNLNCVKNNPEDRSIIDFYNKGVKLK